MVRVGEDVQKGLVYLQASPLQTASPNDVLWGVRNGFQHEGRLTGGNDECIRQSC